MFSSRIGGELRPNRLARAVSRVRSEGRHVIDLTESNPTRVGFAYPEDLLSALANPRGLTYVPEPFGLAEARRAVSLDYARRNVLVPSERIVLTSSTSEAYSLLFKLLASAGDDVLVPRPSYPLFDVLTALEAVHARPYDLEYHGVWSIDFDSVERALGPSTRAVLLVSPNNPTGSFVSNEEFDRLAAICVTRRIPLIVDEVFADYELEDGVRRDSGAAVLRQDVLVFGLGGLSKSVGLPQVKLGWIAVGGPEGLVAEALQRLEIVCDTYLSVSTPVQLAAAELLQRGAAVRTQILARIGRNYRRLGELVLGAPSCRALRAEAGWYAVVQVPALASEEDLVVDLLVNDGVLTHPGYFYDLSHGSFVVLSLLPAETSFEVGVRRLLERAVPAGSHEQPSQSLKRSR